MPADEKPPPTKRPANTAFKQQRLKAWQPILTPKTVLPIFVVIGVLFVVLGIVFLVASNKVNQIQFDYTYCSTEAPTSFGTSGKHFPGGIVESWRYTNGTKLCSIRFSVDSDFSAPVFIYYRLTNFYQNHRRYVKSFDANQLKGDKLYGSQLSTNCDPLTVPPSGTTINGTQIPTNGPQNAQYYPCGLIANSMFSDNIGNPFLVSTNTPYVFSSNGISWPSDSKKYGETQWASQPNNVINQFLVPPPLWSQSMPEIYGNGYDQSNLINVATDERFQVWMRTAGLPTFRKLWGKNSANDFNRGVYQIDITDRFNVLSFSGTKGIVISTVSIIGGKNNFLGIAFLTVGLICLALFLIFLVRNMIKPRKMGDHTYLSWNKATRRADADPNTFGDQAAGGAYQPYESSVNQTTSTS